jgi:ATP-dependent Clp protease ATP-binding subunit ClpC
MLRVVFERFTVDARDAVVRAHQTALVLRRRLIDTEHELLGLLDGRSQIISAVFGDLGVETDQIRRLLQDRLTARPHDEFKGQPTFSPEGKEALSMALREVLNLRQRHVGPEHVLLGIVRVRAQDGAREVLRLMGVDDEAVRQAVKTHIQAPEASSSP